MLRALVIALIRLYQKIARPLIGSRCRFHPSCSDYAILAVRQNGVFRGVGLAAWRVIRCAPWTAGGVDYPPNAVGHNG